MKIEQRTRYHLVDDEGDDIGQSFKTKELAVNAIRLNMIEKELVELRAATSGAISNTVDMVLGHIEYFDSLFDKLVPIFRPDSICKRPDRTELEKMVSGVFSLGCEGQYKSQEGS